MKEYVFFHEFKGGTYLTKICSENLDSALLDWVISLDKSSIHGLGEQTKQSLEKAIKDGNYLSSSIKGMQEVSSVSILSDLDSGFLHVVELGSMKSN